jgi:hypothetical protein
MSGTNGDKVVTGDTSDLPDQNQSSTAHHKFASKDSTQTIPTHEARHTPMTNGNSVYANSPAYGRNYFNHFDQQQEELSTSTLAAAITAGSLLGLTAAAAVRWLNGGDFTLFPPPTLSSTSTSYRENNQEVVTEHNRHRLRNTALTQSPQNQKDDESSLLRELVTTVKTQTDRQEELMQQLQDVLKREKMTKLEKCTEQSMKLLKDEKQGIEHTLTSILLELKTIQKQIQDVKASGPLNLEISSMPTSTDICWESRLSSTLERLDAVLASMSSDVTHFRNRSAVPPTTDCPVVSNTLMTFSTEPINSMDQPVGSVHRLAAALSLLAMENELTAMRVGAQLLYLYVVNLASHPRVPRYRKIYTSNDSYQKNVAQLKGAREFLAAVGFVEQETGSSASYWEWSPSAGNGEDNRPTSNNDAREEMFLQRLKEAAAALSVLKTMRRDCDIVDLLKLALSSANISAATLAAVDGPEKLDDGPPSSTTTFTPTRTPASTIGHDNQMASMVPDGAYVYQTPGNGSILSPPTTKKQSCLSLPPADFSSLEQPHLGVGNRPDKVQDESAISNRSLKEPLKTVNEVDSVEITSSDSSFEESAEAALWK